MRLSALLIAGCGLSGWACGPGDGSTLDESGRALAHPYAPGIGSKYGALSFAPTYQDIAREFFGQLCVGCHSGSSAAKGLDLTEEHAFGQLVSVPSGGRPEVARVEPGRPEDSYLITKLEGGPGIVGRTMPRNRPARPQIEIEILRQWIANGATR